MTELLRELLDIAVASGAAVRSGGLVPKPFFVRYGAHAIRVDYNGGSSKDLSLSVEYDSVARVDHPALVARSRAQGGGLRPLHAPRPLDIELCQEDGGHVAAKAKGLSVEWQSGDVAFDHAVYVDTPTTDPEVLAAVLGPEVRRATCELLELGFRFVRIDDGGEVLAHLNEFSSAGPPRANRGADSLRAFSRIVTNLPAISSSGRMVRRIPLLGATILLGIVGGIGWGGSIFYLEGVLSIARRLFDLTDVATNLAWSEIAMAVAVGVVAGLLGAFVYGRLVAALARGTSSAHKTVQVAQLASFGATSVVAFTVAVVALVLSHGR